MRSSQIPSGIKPVEFQAFAWNVDDGVVSKPAFGDSKEMYSQEEYDCMNFTVHIFGKTKEGKSVATHAACMR